MVTCIKWFSGDHARTGKALFDPRK